MSEDQEKLSTFNAWYKKLLTEYNGKYNEQLDRPSNVSNVINFFIFFTIAIALFLSFIFIWYKVRESIYKYFNVHIIE